jgi:branched-chain amino acid transport system permease protein
MKHTSTIDTDLPGRSEPPETAVLRKSGIDLRPMLNASRWRLAEIAFWVLPVFAYFAFPESLVLLSQIAITALFAMSLNLILGYAGIVSLGHAAFFGVGAYAAGLLASHGIGDPLIGLLSAAALAGAVGFLTSFLVLRGTDLTRLMVTLGLAMMLFEAANKLSGVTGGVDGLQGIQMLPVFGKFSFDLYGKTAYIYSMATLFVLFWLARKLIHSPFGVSLQGIRQNVHRMPALGVPVKTRLVVIYTIGAVYAGVAGALLAQTTQYVTIDVFGFARSADLLLIVILGGVGTLYGPLIGAIVFTVAHHLLSDISPQYWQFWLGATLLVIVLFARGGIMSPVRRLHAVLKAKSGKA